MPLTDLSMGGGGGGGGGVGRGRYGNSPSTYLDPFTISRIRPAQTHTKQAGADLCQAPVKLTVSKH